MKENIQIVFGLLGGLAVFIYGMNTVSYTHLTLPTKA